MAIELTDSDDPLLFAITLPAGRLVFQVNEIVATTQGFASGNGNPTVADIVRAMREGSRTQEVAKNATDAQLFAAYARAAQRMEQAGNG